MKFVNDATGVLHFTAGRSGTSPLERVELVGNGANVVVDNKCVTSRGGGTAMEFSLALVEILFSKETRKDVEGGLAIV